MAELMDVLRGIADFSVQAFRILSFVGLQNVAYHLQCDECFRLAVVGECKGPHMFDITELIGRKKRWSAYSAPSMF